jgi:hypothetical protein
MIDQIDVSSTFGPREELPLPTIGIEVGHEGEVKKLHSPVGHQVFDVLRSLIFWDVLLHHSEFS